MLKDVSTSSIFARNVIIIKDYGRR